MFEKEVMSINRLTKFFRKQFAQPRSQGSVLPVPTFVYLRTVTGGKVRHLHVQIVCMTFGVVIRTLW